MGSDVSLATVDRRVEGTYLGWVKHVVGHRRIVLGYLHAAFFKMWRESPFA